MAYCTFEDVARLLPKLNLRAASSPVGQLEVEELITEIDAQMKGVAEGNGYNSAPTDADAVASLRSICASGVASLVEQAAFPADPNAGKLRWQRYQEGLRTIRAGEVAGLEAASSGSTVALPRSNYTADPDSQADLKFVSTKKLW